MSRENVRRYTEEECIRALQEASKVLGKGFSQMQYKRWAEQQKDVPNYTQIYRKFGKFNEGKRKAGLIIQEQRGGVSYKEDQFNEALLRCARDLGRTQFTQAEFEEWRDQQKDRYKLPAYLTIERHGIKKIKENLGLEILPVGGFGIEKDLALADLMEFVSSQLSIDSYAKWSKNNRKASIPVVKKHFGSYSNGLQKVVEAFVDRKENKRRN